MKTYSIPRTGGAPDWNSVPAQAVNTVFRNPDCGVRFHKCGDRTEHPHFLVWNPANAHFADYNRPEFFGQFCLTQQKKRNPETILRF